MLTLKTTVHTIRYQGEPSTATKNFGKKFVVFTIKRDEIEENEILKKTSTYMFGMQNKHLLLVNGYLEEELEEGTRCEISIDLNNLSYEPQYKMYSMKANSIKKLLEVTPSGFLRYLNLKYKGIGPKLSDKIFKYLTEKYGEENSQFILEHFVQELMNGSKEFIKVMGPRRKQHKTQ
jgi:hypothetical protein